MKRSPDSVMFTLAGIHQAARDLFEAGPDAVVAFRLLREVLHVPRNDPEYLQAKSATLKSKWVRQLEETQLPDGSWGRFHSQDAKKKSLFRTTEEAIDRAFALGLEPSDQVLVRVRQYILEALQGHIHITDPPEKNERWSLLEQLILAGRLAQLEPLNPILGSFRAFWIEVARQAFASGYYRLEDESTAIYQLSGIHAPQGYLESQHALWILSKPALPIQLDRPLVDWILNKPDGIRYIRVPLADPHPRQIGFWLRSMNILSRFVSWGENSTQILNHIWTLRDNEGLWDFGGESTRGVDFPLSKDWRKNHKRKTDYSACILMLLQRYFD